MRITSCRLGYLLLLVATLLGACAQTPEKPIRPAGTAQDFWTGRLSLRIQSEPPQSLATQFELSGNAQAGKLLLTSPLGTTLASMQWSPGFAVLQRSGERQQFGSLDELTQSLTGSALPIEALFEWLRGQAVSVAGWSVDLSQLQQGRLLARQLPPAIPAELRLIIEP